MVVLLEGLGAFWGFRLFTASNFSAYSPLYFEI